MEAFRSYRSVEYTFNEKAVNPEPTPNNFNFQKLAESLLSFIGIRPQENDTTSPPSNTLLKQNRSCQRVTAYVQFKNSNPKDFNGVVTFFQQNNGSTVVYGQWNGLKDLDPMNYEFVIYKNGVAQRDMTINIRRGIEFEGNSAFLRTTFDSLPLSGIGQIIGGSLYISYCGKFIE
ncbi:1696_t:CDS:2 [Diversispora eburnea]|uniref:1696_t:CDS:1 n=1 Tax=Diversispora eburnea TaxID=1213867 RepID=A0A9N8Z789_9GLOM|nr:1696_t:CDS:2 [Diversispora eburnea]